MRKLSTLAASGLLLAALALPSTPAIADGPECNTSSHCYGIAGYNVNPFTATGQELWTDCLSLDTPVGDFATHEMWITTSAPYPSGNMKPFIEMGYIRGGPIAGGDSNTHFRHFWAEWTGTSYHSHYIQSAWILNYINFSMYKQADNRWKLYINGSEKGTTVQQAAYGDHIQTGGETTEPQVYSHGKSRYLQYQNASTGAWTWPVHSYHGGTSNVYHVNVNVLERMEQYSLQKICEPLPGGPVGTFGAKNITMDDFKASALEFAKQNGEANPTAVQAVSAKRRAVNDVLLSGAKVDTDSDVHVIQMKGNFTGHMASRPKDSKAPTGKVMTLVYDATTGEVTDWGLSPDAKDMARLGSVKKL